MDTPTKATSQKGSYEEFGTKPKRLCGASLGVGTAAIMPYKMVIELSV